MKIVLKDANGQTKTFNVPGGSISKIDVVEKDSVGNARVDVWVRAPKLPHEINHYQFNATGIPEDFVSTHPAISMMTVEIDDDIIVQYARVNGGTMGASPEECCFEGFIYKK